MAREVLYVSIEEEHRCVKARAGGAIAIVAGFLKVSSHWRVYRRNEFEQNHLGAIFHNKWLPWSVTCGHQFESYEAAVTFLNRHGWRVE